MLKIVKSMSQLDISKLMYVYSEGNTQNGAELYPHLSIEAQIREAELDFYRYLNDVFFRIADAFYAVLESDYRYLAALRLEPYRDGWLLCALETAPGERKKGYATELINSVKKYLIVKGDFKIYSHVSKRNLASLSVHRKCGFKTLLDYAVYLDGSVLHNSYTLILDSKKSETL